MEAFAPLFVVGTFLAIYLTVMPIVRRGERKAAEETARGHACYGAGDMAGAEAAWRAAIAWDLTHIDAWYQLGRLLLELGRTDEAITCLREVIRVQPEHGEAAERLAIARQLETARRGLVMA